MDAKYRTVITAAALVLASLMLRLFLFSGFVLGDDPAYTEIVDRILKNAYAVNGPYDVFAYRPIVLYAITCCIRLFGWFEGSFILPVLCASLLNTVIVYFAGVKLAGARAGVLAAAAYIVFPLDVVFATTMCNDIMLSTFVWGGGLLLLYCKDLGSARAAQALALVSGLVVGAGVGVKFNAILAPGLFLGLGVLYVLRSGCSGFYKVLAAWIGGWLAANAALCLLFYNIGGDFLGHYHTEMRLYIDNYSSGIFMPDGTSLKQVLLEYPILIGIVGLWTRSFTSPSLPYGYFFLAFLLCTPLCFFQRFKALRLPSLCALFYLLIMEFAAIKIYPHYVPIHRLPRFLHIASLPAAVALGIAFSCLLSFRFRTLQVSAVLVFLFYAASSLCGAWVTASLNRDCALDSRWAWDEVRTMPAQEIITDFEMRNYFLFRSGYNPPWRIEFYDKIPACLPADAIVITGGTRRPEIAANFLPNWLQGKMIPAELWVAESPYELRPWRLSKLTIYKTDREVELGSFGLPSAEK